MFVSLRPSRKAHLKAALLGSILVPFAALLPPAAHAQAAGDTAPIADALRPAPAAIDAGMRTTLAQFGAFTQHPAYGEVWVPTGLPADWHPYPACHWVNAKSLGWYYDDRTAWGAIVHHYGRWRHDAKLGWLWVPGAEFSPGWVVWRTSPDYIGWAPMPPDQDVKTSNADTFNNAGFWTFMETARFDKGCAGGLEVAAQQVPALLQQTAPVTGIAFVGGIATVQLPPYVTGPLVDVTIVYRPWTTVFIERILETWTIVWTTIDIKTVLRFIECPPNPPVIKRIVSPPQLPPQLPPRLPNPPVLVPRLPPVPLTPSNPGCTTGIAARGCGPIVTEPRLPPPVLLPLPRPGCETGLAAIGRGCGPVIGQLPPPVLRLPRVPFVPRVPDPGCRPGIAAIGCGPSLVRPFIPGIVKLPEPTPCSGLGALAFRRCETGPHLGPIQVHPALTRGGRGERMGTTVPSEPQRTFAPHWHPDRWAAFRGGVEAGRGGEVTVPHVAPFRSGGFEGFRPGGFAGFHHGGFAGMGLRPGFSRPSAFGPMVSRPIRPFLR